MADDIKKLKKEHQLFTWTKPFGYDFDEVEAAIADYKNTISDVYELMADKDQHIRELDQRYNQLIKEMTNTRMQMEALTIPDYSEQQSLEILDDFAADNGNGQNVQQSMGQNAIPQQIPTDTQIATPDQSQMNNAQPDMYSAVPEQNYNNVQSAPQNVPVSTEPPVQQINSEPVNNNVMPESQETPKVQKPRKGVIPQIIGAE